ncbi:unnamed protein product [Nyctereutes procyonoides]|uniref:(raccoon dog) hypothetical protein n=1 Tax=Nyctereutes procyonoides TaxID=34880 RepID=A0A811Y4L7_NYCPR|nr:unnamed protein product [Nyctereutes procyonoides]
MGEGDTGGDGTHLAAPPPLPVAAAEPAAPGTIFRRRLLLGGGYQPPIGHRQPTRPPASRVPVTAPDSRREGGSRGAGATREPEGSAEGSAGPRTPPRRGLLLSTPALPPRSMPGNGGRGEGRPGDPGGAGRRAQVRKSAGSREGGGSARSRRGPACGSAVLW